MISTQHSTSLINAGAADAASARRRASVGAVSTKRFHTAVDETTRDSPPKVLFSMHIRPTMSALSVWNGCAAQVV